MNALKICNLADRDTALNQFTGPELHILFRKGLVNDLTPISLKPDINGAIVGRSALILHKGWNPTIRHPGGGGHITLDYTPAGGIGTGSAAFPGYGDPFFSGMGYSQNELKVYNATEGQKGGIIQEDSGLLTLLGADDNNRIVLKNYTQNMGNSYGNAPNLLSQSTLKDVSGALIYPSTKVWMRFVNIMGGDDGLRGRWAWVFERDVNYIGCANGSGQTHARYLDLKAFVSADCLTQDTMGGHDYKTRAFGVAVVYRPKMPPNRATQGESYRWDMNGGDNVLIGGFCQDGAGDSNGPTMFRLNVTQGEPWGPHSFTRLGFRADTNLPGVKGTYLRIDDAAPMFTPDTANPDWFVGNSVWGQGGWKTAAQITRADGSKVWMPITVVEDGNDNLYAAFRNPAYTFGASCDADGNTILPTDHAITQIKGKNRVLDRASDAAKIDGTRIDLSKLGHLGALAPMIAAGNDPDWWTPDRMDQLMAAAVARRAAFVYPSGAPSPAPIPVPVPPPYDEDTDPVLIAENARLNALVTQLQTDAAAKDATIAAKDQALADANAKTSQAVLDRDAANASLQTADTWIAETKAMWADFESRMVAGG